MQQNEDLQEENADPNLNGAGPSLVILKSWFQYTDSSTSAIDERAFRMMQKMGYKPGSGLGKDEQGITQSIEVNVNLGKRGLGLKLDNLNLSDDSWDFSQEDIMVCEKVPWISSTNNKALVEENIEMWIKEGLPNEDVVGNSTFCDEEVLQNVFKAKNIFEELDIAELNQARTRANPYETIRSVFFMNRAALKMANIDAACDFMFTSMEANGPVFFADVCAGPGGFTEYILWRKQWLYKCFGLTLKDEHDFKVSESTCASASTFQALYGVDERGDVCNPENLKDFTERVRNETHGKGVHFMMSDGGFCVDGHENLQEVLSKNIYVCQCLLALNILRPHGHFVTKTFDIFTPFSAGLLYLMYLCFEKVGIIKPNSSRPANSERYFVCNNFKVHPSTNIIRNYLWKIAIRLWEIRTLPDKDILEIVPVSVLRNDQLFFRYIVDSNTIIGKRQIVALRKLAQFCRNPSLVEMRQDSLRTQCLEYWNIPDNKKRYQEVFKVENALERINLDERLLTVQLQFINSTKTLESVLIDVSDWHYCFLYSTPSINRTNFYAGLGFFKTYRLQNNRWIKVRHLELTKGTLLYGEFVKETTLLENGESSTRYSLHVIDALFLGSTDLRHYTYQERLNFLNTFCKAVNKESQAKYTVRVRQKAMRKLADLPQDFSLMRDGENFCVSLPKMGYKSTFEKHEVNSVLLMKTNACRSFESTNLLGVQVCNTKDQSSFTLRMSFDELTKTVNNLLA